MIGRRTLVRVLAALLLAISVATALSEARPGGGETYSTGRSGRTTSRDDGGRGGADGDGAFVVFIIQLCWRHPFVGIPLVLIALAFVALSRGGGRSPNWDSAQSLMHGTDETPPPRAATIPLARIGRVDPDFSAVLFEDFAFRLYAAVHIARGAGKLDELAPYVSASARDALAARTPTGPVAGVVVGAMHAREIYVPRVDENRPDAFVRVVLEFEANYSVGIGEGSRRFVVEEWVLRRAASARTRAPEPARRFPCPNCGAPWRTESAAGTQKCASCGAVVDNGRFDWQVVEIHLRHDRGSAPGLSEEVPERGTSLPTRKDAQFAVEWATLMQEDAGVTSLTIAARLEHIYAVVNDAWTRHDLNAARAVLSDGLADYLQYWLDAYDEQGLHNVLEDMRVTRHELVKLRRDRYYDALTVRLWAAGKDYVIRTSDRAHVRGSQSDERTYSEYWTLIRAAGRRGAPAPEATCGGCGAPLVVSMAGACTFCGAHVTAGEFDWVLSKIEQDDSYQG